MTHDAVLVFSKSWGALYLLVCFLAVVIWTYWPSKRATFEEAERWPLEEEDRPWR